MTADCFNAKNILQLLNQVCRGLVYLVVVDALEAVKWEEDVPGLIVDLAQFTLPPSPAPGPDFVAAGVNNFSCICCFDLSLAQRNKAVAVFTEAHHDVILHACIFVFELICGKKDK